MVSHHPCQNVDDSWLQEDFYYDYQMGCKDHAITMGYINKETGEKRRQNEFPCFLTR